MEKVTIEEFTVYGISTRTNNQDEMVPGKSKIAPLWERFYGELNAKGKLPSVSYGVYSNFESDQHGEYDTTAAQKESIGFENEQMLTIPSATYLRFSISGELPAACMTLWQTIWTYFESKNAPNRTFICDYEEYLSMTDMAIYISIEE